MNLKDSIGKIAKYQGGESPVDTYYEITKSSGGKMILTRLKDGTVLNYEVIKVKNEDDNKWEYLEN